MNVEITRRLRGAKREAWEKLLDKAGLIFEGDAEETALVWEGDALLAAGSREKYLFKYIAVDPDRRGEDLTSSVISALRAEAFGEGYDHIFLYTKPENESVFSSLFFYPIASTDRALLMESRKGGINEFISSLPSVKGDRVGAIVMNCNPFTLGHKYLIEKAAGECDALCVFVLSEDKSLFSSADRIEMVRRGTEHLSNVTVMPTGNYLISAATFPAYFIKDATKAADTYCNLDIEIFEKYFVPHFNISVRYVGSEPLSPTTAKYNEALAARLPLSGIELVEVERVEEAGAPISASRVRELIKTGKTDDLSSLLPESTIEYLKSNNLI